MTTYEEKVKISDSRIMQPVDVQGANIQLPVDIQGQAIPLDVDTLNTEDSITDEIDTSAESSPYTLLTPSSGKAIRTRGYLIHTDSNSGEITLKYQNSGKIIGKLYASVQNQIAVHRLNVPGDTDDPVVLEWSGVTSGAKIFVALTYKEV